MDALDNVKLRVIPQVNTDPSTNVFPYLIEYEDLQELEETLNADLTVENYELVSKDDGTGIYYLEYSDETKLISEIVTSVNGFMTEAKTKNPGWLVKLQLPDREALNTVWEYAEEEGIHIEIIGIYDSSGSDAETSYGLTSEQEEALIVAFESGYFSEPRDKGLSEIADEVDLSSTAMSGRLRRGMRNLVAAALTDEN
jgi:predicted DNA binding protein